MTAETRKLRVSILRGGTSRGLFFHEDDLPKDRNDIGALLLNIMGSPDVRQINGLGGATPQTSKVAIIKRSLREDADIDYTFAQVDISRPFVDWGGNCGNISSAVGPFAINEALVDVPEGEALGHVRIYNTNTGKIIVAHVPVVAGRAAVEGACFIAGVPSPGARIELEFRDPTGAVTGQTLPTGRPVDLIKLNDGWSCEVSVVDAANPSVFISADVFGLSGLELPAELEQNFDFLRRIEEVRSQVAVLLDLVAEAANATAETPGLPKIGIVAAPQDYEDSSGKFISADSYDIAVRMMSMQFPHRACQITGGICLGVASLVPGSVASRYFSAVSGDSGRTAVRLGHPSGVMEVVVNGKLDSKSLDVAGVAVVRTARHILDGVVHVPERLYAHSNSN